MVSDDKKLKIISLLSKSKSQNAQDLFVISNTNQSNTNFFVEFGATDGIDKSNTFLLEKEFGWNGILVEPASIWHKDLKNNRNCIIDTKCVYSKSGEDMEFIVVDNDGKDDPSLSSLKKYINNNDWASSIRREKHKKEIVKTITLDDLLDFHKAPSTIDYLSIDTEGSEYDILENFNFSKRKIKIITVEHNYDQKKRSLIFELLKNNGYKRVFVNISDFDDWYILEN